MTIQTLQATANIGCCRPNEKQMAEMLSDVVGTSKEDKLPLFIEEGVGKAERWLERATVTVNQVFRFWSGNEGEGSVCVEYREGEDLGWDCNNPGHSPFNEVYPEGPTVHVVMTGKVGFEQKRPNEICFNSFHHSVEGPLLIVQLPAKRLFVAFRWL